MAISHDNKPITEPVEPEEEPVESYERPELVDYGTLAELTMSGLTPLTDSLLGGGS
jgi:hypothetical protein